MSDIVERLRACATDLKRNRVGDYQAMYEAAEELEKAALNNITQFGELQTALEKIEKLEAEIEKLQENLSLAECYIGGEYWDYYMSKKQRRK